MIFLSSTIGRDLASDVIGRGTPLYGHPDDPQPPKLPVLDLTSLRDEDLRLLSAVTRRALNLMP